MKTMYLNPKMRIFLITVVVLVVAIAGYATGKTLWDKNGSNSESAQATIAIAKTSQDNACMGLSPSEIAQAKQNIQNNLPGLKAQLSDAEKNHNGNSNPEIEIFIKTSASQSDIDNLGQQIKSMSEVKSVEFVSKDEALQKLNQSMQGHTDVLNALQGNPLPASYIVTLNDPNQVDAVASRFYANPIVDNDPGTHDGVKTGGDTEQKLQSEIKQDQDILDNC